MTKTKDPQSITISEELLDKMVNALTQLPYRDVQHLFVQLGHEIASQHEDNPQLVVRN